MRCVGSIASGVTALVALCLSAPARAELVVNISKSQQRLEVVVNGAEAYRWPVSTGRRGYTTPSGTFHPIRLERHWYSHKYEMSPMPWSVFFHRGYAVHGTMESYNLGHAASHGCVRLRPDNASILFSLVRRHGIRNTKLVVMNGPLPQAPQPAQGVPMAAVDHPADQAQQHFAKATAKEGEEHLSAKSHDPSHESAHPRADDGDREVRAHARTRIASVERVSVSRGNEAQVLREREAWLRSLDRKYGFTH
jgi:hypothetical protein